MTEENNQTESTELAISVQDILILKQVVEVASARGALRANELTQVGNTYDRVSAWLDTVVPKEELEEDTDSEQSEEERDDA